MTASATPWPAVAAPDSREVPEVGALVEWWKQLRRAQRTIRTNDVLRAAAILEANARDAVKLGQRAAANRGRLKAAALLVVAATEATS